MIEIKDNFLEENYFNELYKLVTSEDIEWHYNNKVTDRNTNIESFYFAHNFLNNGIIQSKWAEAVNPLLSKLDINVPIRVKANLYPNIGKKHYNKPHVDYTFPCKGAILYLNSNDAPTTIEDTEVESIANRLVIFDASKPHYSCNPSNVKARFNININYI